MNTHKKMKLIAVEEHFLTDDIRKAWNQSSADDPTQNLHVDEVEDRLDDVGKSRIKLMDETGVDV